MFNKKAQFFNWFLSLGTIGVLIIAFMVLKPVTWDSTIGKRQFDVIEGHLSQEQKMLMIEQGARLASYRSLNDLAVKGGFYKAKDSCGMTSHEFYYWNKKDKNLSDCFPDFKSNAEKKISDNLNFLLNKDKNLKHLSGDYEVSIVENSVLGISKEMLFYPKQPPEQIDDNKKFIDEIGFDHYRISAFTKINCDENWEIDDNYYAEIWGDFNTLDLNSKVNSGDKRIHADLRYRNYDQTDYDLIAEPNPEIKTSEIGTEPGKYCFAYNANPLYNIKLETLKGEQIICSVESKEYSEETFSGKDLRTWNPSNGDTSCKDSKTWLQCPGIKIYYCGKTGYDSFPRRAEEFPDWRIIKKSEDDKVKEYFVEVRNDELAESYHIRSKTSFKFLVEIDKEINPEGKSIERDSWSKKWISDSYDSIKVRLTDSGVKGEEQFPFYYSVQPSFNIEIDPRIKEYLELRSYAEEILSSCSSADTSCIQETLKEKNLNYELNINGKSAEITVYSTKNVMVDEGEKLSFEPLRYMFALDFS